MTGRLYLDIETCNAPPERADIARPWMKVSANDRKLTQAEEKAVIKSLQEDSIQSETTGALEIELQSKIHRAQDTALASTALNGLWGEVVAIGYAPDDDTVMADHRSHEVTEKELLEGTAKIIGWYCEYSWNKTNPTVIGHNIGFDLRFLFQRYIVNGLRPPHWLVRAMNAKPWEDEKVYDTMIQWTGQYNRDQYPKLGALCAGLGIDLPATIDGSEVPQAWLDGRHDEIRAHVLADVEAVRQVHRRMAGL